MSENEPRKLPCVIHTHLNRRLVASRRYWEEGEDQLRLTAEVCGLDAMGQEKWSEVRCEKSTRKLLERAILELAGPFEPPPPDEEVADGE